MPGAWTVARYKWHAGGQRFDPAWLHQFSANRHHHRIRTALTGRKIGGAKRLSARARQQLEGREARSAGLGWLPPGRRGRARAGC